MLILDSSCWLEYFLNGAKADEYAPVIEGSGDMIVPAIVLHEVFKVVMRSGNEEMALAASSALQRFPVIPVDENVAMYSARLAVEQKLAMADSIILATARINNATLWTQDADFEDIADVRYISK